jgi:TetR/AcrR family transcriptional regulator
VELDLRLVVSGSRASPSLSFGAGVDPIEFCISTAALGFFYMSNRHTLSTIFGQNLNAPERLAQRGAYIVEDVSTLT